MDDRKLTVYNGRGAFKKSPPQILLQGNWLEQNIDGLVEMLKYYPLVMPKIYVSLF